MNEDTSLLSVEPDSVGCDASGDSTEVGAVAPPDCGARAWAVVVGSFVAHFFILGTIYSAGVFLLPWEEGLNLDRSAVSWMSSVQLTLMLLGAPIVGWLSDHVAWQALMVMGSVLSFTGLLLASYADRLWHLIVSFGVLTGLGFALCFVPAISSVGQWHVKRRGVAMGLAVAGSGAGNLALPPILTEMILRLGWRKSVRIYAFIVFAGMIGATLLVRARIKTHRTYSLRHIVGSKSFRIIIIAKAIAAFGYLIPFIHIVPYAEEEGMDPLLAATLLSAVGASSLVGRILLGAVGDVVGHMLILRVSAASLAVWAGLWLLFHTAVGLFAFALAYGFWSGAYISTVPSVMADRFGMQALPTVLGIAYCATAAGNLGGGPAAGAMFDATGSYTSAISVTCATLGVASVILLFVPRKEAMHGDAS